MDCATRLLWKMNTSLIKKKHKEYQSYLERYPSFKDKSN